MARRERRVLLTFDKGFGDLVRHGPDDESYGVILFRKPVSTAVEASAWIVSMVTARDDWTGSFSVLERDKVRVRALQSFPPER